MGLIQGRLLSIFNFDYYINQLSFIYAKCNIRKLFNLQNHDKTLSKILCLVLNGKYIVNLYLVY